MITVEQIIDRKGAAKIAEAIGEKPGKVRMWKLRDSIPGEHWKALADKGVATLEELASSAAQKAA